MKNIKKKINNFTNLNFSNSFRSKLAIFDGADEINFHTQMNLRENLEKHLCKINFWLTCNSIYKMNPAVVSRCVNLNFRSIYPLDSCIRLKEISEKEKIRFNLEFLENASFLSNGDLREIFILLSQSKINDKNNIFFNFLEIKYYFKNFMREIIEIFFKDKRFIIIRKFYQLFKKKIKGLSNLSEKLNLEILNYSIFFNEKNLIFNLKEKISKKKKILFNFLKLLIKFSSFKKKKLRDF
jgi:DNA polymerase III delta prime subunit